MNPVRLISEIMRGKWAIDPMFAISQGAVVAGLLNRQTEFLLSVASLDDEEGNPNYFAIQASDPLGVRYNYYRGFDKAPKNSVAVILLTGSLMKDDLNCGPDGMATIGRILKEADAHPSISGILLVVDSPGGTIDGTETLANIVKSLKKPAVTFVDGLMASAALWIGSGTREIWASTDTDEVGSVGVLLSFADMQPAWEKQGIVFHSIVASTSPDKRKVWEDLRAGNYEQYIKEVLNPLDEKFMSAVKANRPLAEDRHLTGKLFFARDVMGVFVDRIGTFEEALARVAELAAPEVKTETTDFKNNLSMKQFSKINATLNVEELVSGDEGVYLNEEQLELIETSLSQQTLVAQERDSALASQREAETARTQAEESLTASHTAFDDIDPTIAAAATAHDKAAAVRALLASRPGAKPAGVETQKDLEVSNQDVDWDYINKLPHNQNVD